MAKIIWRDPQAAPTTAARQANAMAGGSATARRGREQESDAEESPIEKPTEDDKMEVCFQDAWYEAKLAVKGQRVRVTYVEYSSDREFWDVAVIQQAHPLRDLIRVASAQLQDAECRAVSLNTRVCALKRSEDEDGWYDAIVKEIARRIHAPHPDGGEVCTCSFTVVWLSGPDKDRVGKHLRCEHICTISRKDIRFHPVILDIFSRCNEGGFQDREQNISKSQKVERAGQGARFKGSSSKKNGMRLGDFEDADQATRWVDDQSRNSSGEGSKSRLQPPNELSPIGDIGSQQQATKRRRLGSDIYIASHGQRPDISAGQSESEDSEPKADPISGDQKSEKKSSEIGDGAAAVSKAEVCCKEGPTSPARSDFSRGHGHLKFYDAECIPHKTVDPSTHGSHAIIGNESCNRLKNVFNSLKVEPARSSQNLSVPSDEKKRVLGKHMGHLNAEASAMIGDEDKLHAAGKCFGGLVNDCPNPNDGGTENKIGLGKERKAARAKRFQNEDFLGKEVICLSDDDDDDDFDKMVLSSTSSNSVGHVKGVKEQLASLPANKKAVSEQLREQPGGVMMMDDLEKDLTQVQRNCAFSNSPCESAYDCLLAWKAMERERWWVSNRRPPKLSTVI